MKTYSQQNRQPASHELAMLQETLLNQSEKIAYQQEQLNNLGKGFRDIAEILQKQHQSNPTQAIEENNQNLVAMTNAMVSWYKQLKEANFGQEFTDLKLQQQSISKVVVTNRKNLESQANSLTYYFGWKRIATIVLSTAIISSLLTVAIVAWTPWAIEQITKKIQSNPPEKSTPVVKKHRGNRS